MNRIATVSLAAALMLGTAFAQSTTGSAATKNAKTAKTDSTQMGDLPKFRGNRGKKEMDMPVPVHSQTQTAVPNAAKSKPAPAAKKSQDSTTSTPTAAVKSTSGASQTGSTKKTASGQTGNQSSEQKNSSKKAPTNPGGPPAATGPNSPALDTFVQNMGQSHPKPSTGKQGSAASQQKIDSEKFGSQPASGDAKKSQTSQGSSGAHSRPKDTSANPKQQTPVKGGSSQKM